MRPATFIFLGTISCGGSTTAETTFAEDAAAEVVDTGEPVVVDSAAPDTRVEDVAADVATGSRCTVTESTVSCTHHVTPLLAGPGVIREVYWQTPLTPMPAGGHPAVIVFQGSFGGPALTWSTLSKSTPFGGFYQGVLHARLLDKGFTVIAPSAAAGSVWQSNTGAIWETTTDSVFMRGLLDAIAKGTYGAVDAKRLYATGVSSGGYMTSRMAVSYAGKFRALAIQSGSYATCLGAICNVPDALPADHPPTLFLHGEKDATVPIATMTPYFDKLKARGVATEKAIDPAAAHEWLSVAPERITAWFVAH